MDVPPQQTTLAVETTTADSTTEETRSLEKTSRVTEATEPAVSVQTSVNFTSSSDVFEDFQPSNYYGADGNPIFERPSPGFGHEVFHKPQLFARPNSQFLGPPKSADNNNTHKNNVVFPRATQKHYSEYSQYENQPNEPVESKGPYKFTTAVLPQPQSRDPYKLLTTGVLLPQPQSAKPLKHDYDSGSLQPVSYYDENLYERHFGKTHLHGKEVWAYPDEPPPKFHHGGGSVAVHKKDPWRSVLKVLATILPVGLLLASFPPTVIKVNSTQYPYQ